MMVRSEDLEVWWLHPWHQLVDKAARIFALYTRSRVAKVVDDVLMKANVDSSTKNKRNQLWKVDGCTWPVVNFFLASVVPRSARNWSRPPPSAISLSLQLHFPCFNHHLLPLHHHLLHLQLSFTFSPPLMSTLFSFFSQYSPRDLWNNRMVMSPFTFTGHQRISLQQQQPSERSCIYQGIHGLSFLHKFH